MEIKKKLQEIFPSIRFELGSLRSRQLTNLLQEFNNLYSFRAQSVVIVKGIAELMKVGNASLTMGLENSVYICSSKISEQERLYFSSEENQEEIILDKKGKTIQGPTEQAKRLTQIYNASIDDLSLKKVNGGIFYMQSNISESFSKNSCQTLGLFLSFLQNNGMYTQYEPEQIMKKLIEFKLIDRDLEQDVNIKIKEFFKYKHRHLLANFNGNLTSIPIGQDDNFIFYKTRPSFQQQYNLEIQNYREKMSKLSKTIEQMTGMILLGLSFQEIQQKLFKDYSQEDKILLQINYSKVQALHNLFKTKNIKTFFEQLLKNQTEILSEQLNAEISSVLKQSHIPLSILLQNGEYLVFYSSSAITCQHIRILSSIKIAQKKEDEKNKQEDQEFFMEGKWSNKYNVRKQVFGCCPSKVFDVLVPENQIQTDDLM